jgi:ribosomal protein S18 acetylase RimI-like enzyme
MDYVPYERSHLDGLIALCVAEGWPTFAEDFERAHRVLTASGTTTLVAVGGDRVVGYAQIQSDGEIQAHLSNIVVDRAFRRSGIARELVTRAFEIAGGIRVDLITDSAEGFYADFAHRRLSGFRIFPQYTQDDIDG